MIDITPIIEFLFLGFLGLIAYFVVPFIQARTTTEQQKGLLDLVAVAVTAAEQIYRSSGKGAEKKEYVINWLKERKITFDENKIDAMIEAAVYKLNANKTKTPESDTVAEDVCNSTDNTPDTENTDTTDNSEI